MRLFSFLSVLFLVTLGFVRTTQADVILSYGNATGTTANFAAAGVTAAVISENDLQQTVDLAWTGFSNQSIRRTDDYVQWGFSSTTAIDLTSLQLNLERTNSGPDMLNLLVSVDGGAFSQVGGTLTAFVGSPSLQSVDLTSLANASSAVFRLHGFSAQAVNGQLFMRDHASFGSGTALVLNGTAVPEPSSAVAISVLSCLVFTRRRRH